MFSRWMFVRLRAAENALHEGRLDEAHRRLCPADMRDQRKARELRAELAQRLIARVRLHVQAGRYREALDDLDRVDAIGGATNDSAALRARAEEELRHRVGRHVKRDDAFNRAEQHLRDGRLDSGRAEIENLEDPKRREQLREELDVRARRSEQLIEQASDALARGDVLGACRNWEQACERHGRGPHTDALAARLLGTYRATLDGWLRDGRLDRVGVLLDATRALRLFAPELAEYERVGRLVHKAVEQFSTSDFGALRETLLRMRTACAGAEWIATALDGLDRIDAARGELLSSPLGLLGPSLHKTSAIRTDNAADAAHNAPERSPVIAETHGASLGEDALMLLVDGTGSCLVSTRNTLRIGRAGSAVDIPIPADLNSHHADIVRQGEDYFLLAHGPVQVNRRAVSRTLLRDGDRITLGRTARMTFRIPSVKSESAVLELASRSRLAQDVDRVVLFRGMFLIGPQTSCHVRTREGDSRLVIFERRGQLHVRRAGRDGRPTGPAEALPMRQTRDYGDVRLTLMKYQPEAGGAA